MAKERRDSIEFSMVPVYCVDCGCRMLVSLMTRDDIWRCDSCWGLKTERNLPRLRDEPEEQR